MIRKWYGAEFTFGNINSGSDESAFRHVISFGDPNTHDNDNLARILVQYQIWTDLHENSIIGDQFPGGAYAYVSFTPNPDAPIEPDNPTGGIDGETLYRQDIEWTQEPWTDGTIFSTKWTASSGGVQSTQANRLLRNVFDSELHVGIVPNLHFIGGFGRELDALWSGWMAVKYLVELKGV